MIDYDPRETLREAADYISEHGWYQGGFVNESEAAKPVCAMGAIFKAVGVNELYHSSVIPHADQNAKARACTHLLETVIGTYDIPEWNDDPSRTAEDVILAMKEASTRE